MVTVGEGEHPLQCPYAFWFSRRPPGKLQSSTSYASNIKLVGKFASVSFLSSWFTIEPAQCISYYCRTVVKSEQQVETGLFGGYMYMCPQNKNLHSIQDKIYLVVVLKSVLRGMISTTLVFLLNKIPIAI